MHNTHTLQFIHRFSHFCHSWNWYLHPRDLHVYIYSTNNATIFAKNVLKGFFTLNEILFNVYSHWKGNNRCIRKQQHRHNKDNETMRRLPYDPFALACSLLVVFFCCIFFSLSFIIIIFNDSVLLLSVLGVDDFFSLYF